MKNWIFTYDLRRNWTIWVSIDNEKDLERSGTNWNELGIKLIRKGSGTFLYQTHNGYQKFQFIMMSLETSGDSFGEIWDQNTLKHFRNVTYHREAQADFHHYQYKSLYRPLLGQQVPVH